MFLKYLKYTLVIIVTNNSIQTDIWGSNHINNTDISFHKMIKLGRNLNTDL